MAFYNCTRHTTVDCHAVVLLFTLRHNANNEKWDVNKLLLALGLYIFHNKLERKTRRTGREMGGRDWEDGTWGGGDWEGDETGGRGGDWEGD